MIKTKKDFKIIANCVDKLFCKERDLPSQVFKEKFKNFRFEGFDISGCSRFWEKSLKPLCRASSDKNIFIVIIGSQYKEPCEQVFKYKDALQVNVDISGEQYSDLIENSPFKDQDYSPYTMAYKVVLFSESGKWAIFGDWRRETLILGSIDDFDYIIPKEYFARWWSPRQAIDGFMSFSFKDLVVPKFWKDEFLKNYSK